MTVNAEVLSLLQGYEAGHHDFRRTMSQLFEPDFASPIEIYRALMQILSAPSKELKYLAPHVASRLADNAGASFEQVLPELLASLDDSSDSRRYVAARILIGAGLLIPEYTATLVELIWDPSTDVCILALQALTQMGIGGDEVLESCKDLALGDRNGRVRLAAMRYFLKWGKDEAGTEDLLFRMMREDKSREVAASVAERLIVMSHGDEGIQKRLKECLSEKIPALVATMRTLQPILPPAMRKGQESTPLTEEALFDVVIKQDQEEGLSALRKLALEIIGQRDPEAHARFVRYDFTTRPGTFPNYGRHLGASVVPVVLEYFGDSRASVRAQAGILLKCLNVPHDKLGEFVRPLLDHADSLVRVSAVYAYSDLRISEDLKATVLRRALSDADSRVVMEALKALGRLGEAAREFKDTLLLLLNERAPQQAAIFATLVRVTNDPELVLPLAWRFLGSEDIDAFEREIILGAIRPFTYELIPGLPLIIRSVELGSSNALDILGELGELAEPALDTLRAMLPCETPYQRLNLADTLLRIVPEDPQGLGELMSLMGHDDPEIRDGARSSLQELGLGRYVTSESCGGVAEGDVQAGS